MTSNYTSVQTATAGRLLYNQLGEPGVRRVLGVLALAKKFGLAAVEEACAAALEMGVYEYRFVRRYLERGPQLTLRQVVKEKATLLSQRGLYLCRQRPTLPHTWRVQYHRPCGA